MFRSPILRRSLQKPLQRLLSPSFCPRAFIPRTRHSSQMSSVPRPYGQAFETVQIKDVDDGEAFYCDEEPHMLTPEQGHGYYPLTLGQQLKDGQLEIVRKLGWAGYSSVWLARTLK